MKKRSIITVVIVAAIILIAVVAAIFFLLGPRELSDKNIISNPSAAMTFVKNRQ